MKGNSKLDKNELINQVITCMDMTEKDLYFELGVGLKYAYEYRKVCYRAPYQKMGVDLWKVLRTEIYVILCDPKKRRPHPWVEEAMTGEIRNLVTGIISALVSSLNLPLGIAIPATALIIKKGILNYCKKGKPLRRQGGVAKILQEKKAEMSKRSKTGRQ
jgi:hypothetical protein